ncbi:MAG: hypothetical protein R3199_04105, partial [Gemmatimonadota bacterium]|nr:hypothetical protein [Gemmatimonadota bacterium]
AEADGDPLGPAVEPTRAAIDRLERAGGAELERAPSEGRPNARTLAFGLAHATAAALLLGHARWAIRAGRAEPAAADAPGPVDAAHRWCGGESALFSCVR